MRYRLQTCGHETLPDLDLTGDDLETAFEHARKNYPCVSFALLEAVSYSAVMRALDSSGR